MTANSLLCYNCSLNVMKEFCGEMCSPLYVCVCVSSVMEEYHECHYDGSANTVQVLLFPLARQSVSERCKRYFLLCSNTKYFWKYVFEILLSNTFELVLKIQNTFFQMYFKYKIHADRQLPFLSTVENVIVHTTQSLQFCYKPVNHIWHSGREAARRAVTAYKLILLH